MTKAPSAQLDSSILAVLHPGGGGWRLVIADTQSGSPRIIEARNVTAQEVVNLDPVLEPHRVGRVLCVLPSASVICRTSPLPDAEPEQLDQALRLQAEAQLLGSAPPHRLATAVLPAASSETTRVGLILAWPVSAEFVPPVTVRPISYTADIAALAALLNSHRPQNPALWVDRSDGSIATAITHSSGVMFRAAREGSSDGTTWQQSVINLISETALSVGHTTGYVHDAQAIFDAALTSVGTDETALIIDQQLLTELDERVTLPPHDEHWLTEYGIAVGGVLAACGPLYSLTQLQADPPVESPSLFRMVVRKLRSPAAALITVVICLLILAFLPLVTSGARLLILQTMNRDLADRKAAVDDVRYKLAVYDTLRSKAWPMTKLLSDIACNTPVGVELELIRLDYGNQLSVSGIAKPDRSENLGAPDVVAQMQANMRESGIFSDIDLNWGDGDAYSNYTFDITARVAKPHQHRQYPVALDFQRWTMQNRVDNKPPPDEAEDPKQLASAPTGNETPAHDPPPASVEDNEPGAIVTKPAPPEDALVEAEPDDGTSRSRRPGLNLGPGRHSNGGANPGDAGERMTAGTGPIEIPEPLTAEQIQAMDLEEVQAALKLVALARQHADLDEETEARLKEEWDILFARLKELQKIS